MTIVMDIQTQKNSAGQILHIITSVMDAKTRRACYLENLEMVIVD